MRRSPATSASASVQTLRSAEVAHDSSTSSAPICAPGPCSSASFSSSRSSRCWRSPTWATSAFAPSLSRSRSLRRGLLDQPLRQVPGLDVDLGRDLAAGLLDGLEELRGRLVAALLAGEEGDREGLRVGGSRAPARPARRRSPSSARRRRRSRTGGPSRTSSCDSAAATFSRRARVALVDLDAGGAGRVLGHRAQARAALGDAAVVVAVDQVGGAEAGTAVGG